MFNQVLDTTFIIGKSYPGPGNRDYSVTSIYHVLGTVLGTGVTRVNVTGMAPSLRAYSLVGEADIKLVAFT